MIKIKEIKNINSLKLFVQETPDEEIQLWKTKDWNDFYKLLDRLVAADISLRTPRTGKIAHQYWRDLKETVWYGNGDFVRWYHLEKDDVLLQKKRHFASTVGVEMLRKLNRNYRLSPEDFSALIKLAKNIGYQLADNKIDLATVSINNSEKICLNLGKLADKTVFNTSMYARKYRYKRAKSDIQILRDNGGNVGGCTLVQSPYGARIDFNLFPYEDTFLEKSVHEAVHAHLQMLTLWQKYQAENGEFPYKELSPEFFELIHHSNEYYVGIYTGNRAERKVYLENRRGYRRQPAEKMAYIIGKVSEHYYRQKTRQYSERSAVYMSYLVYDTVPFEARYDVETISLKFYRKLLGSGGKDKKSFKDKYLYHISEKLYDKFAVKVDDKVFEVKVPNNFETRNFLHCSYCQKRKSDFGALTNMFLGNGRS